MELSSTITEKKIKRSSPFLNKHLIKTKYNRNRKCGSTENFHRRSNSKNKQKSTKKFKFLKERAKFSSTGHLTVLKLSPDRSHRLRLAKKQNSRNCSAKRLRFTKKNSSSTSQRSLKGNSLMVAELQNGQFNLREMRKFVNNHGSKKSIKLKKNHKEMRLRKSPNNHKRRKKSDNKRRKIKICKFENSQLAKTHSRHSKFTLKDQSIQYLSSNQSLHDAILKNLKFSKMAPRGSRGSNKDSEKKLRPYGSYTASKAKRLKNMARNTENSNSGKKLNSRFSNSKDKKFKRRRQRLVLNGKTRIKRLISSTKSYKSLKKLKPLKIKKKSFVLVQIKGWSLDVDFNIWYCEILLI